MFPFVAVSIFSLASEALDSHVTLFECISARFQIDYFNNKIICDLVEVQHQGVLAILDEACMTVGKVTDQMFLEAMSDKLKGHKHFSSRKVNLKNQLVSCLIQSVSHCAALLLCT